MPPCPRQHFPQHLARRAIVLLICFSLGLHWVLLQGIAWTGMIISFASQGTVLEAVEKTFDGQHACALCQTVKEGQESNQDQPPSGGQSLKKINAVLVEIPTLVAPAASTMFFVHVHEEQVRRSEKPEMPPPRRGLA